MRKFSEAQRRMLRFLQQWDGDEGSGYWEYVATCDETANGSLDLRNADRVLDALIRRGLVTNDGDVKLTEAGRKVAP
jgi:hypothetical protein